MNTSGKLPLNLMNRFVSVTILDKVLTVSFLRFEPQVLRFFVKDFFSKCKQIERNLRINAHLLKTHLFSVQYTTLKLSAKHHLNQEDFVKNIGRSLEFLNDSILVNLYSFNLFLTKQHATPYKVGLDYPSVIYFIGIGSLFFLTFCVNSRLMQKLFVQETEWQW